MGLLTCFSIKMPKAINILFLLSLLEHFKFMVLVALTRLLINPPAAELQQVHSTTEEEDDDDDYQYSINSHVLVMVNLSPSLIPVESLMALIKKRLPVIEYSNYVERFGVHEDENMVCSVCLNCVERSHEIRELSNCSHVFHSDCLDRWVDECQVTCPLCRSMLFPIPGMGEILTSCRGEN